MNYLSNKMQEVFSKVKIRNQLNIVYALGFFIPMACIGFFLVINTSRLLSNYHEDLNESNNLRVKTMFFEITSQIYYLSNDIVLDDDLHDLLSKDYKSQKDFQNNAVLYKEIDNYIKIYPEIYSITVYTDNPTIRDFEYISYSDTETKAANWYKKALNQRSGFWNTIKNQDKHGNIYYNLCLVRQIKLFDSDYDAVIMIKIDENYIRNRLDTDNYELLLYVDDGGIFFSSNPLWYDKADMIYIDYDKKYYQFDNHIFFEDKKYMTSVSTLELYQTDNRMYICTMDNSAFNNIYQILSLCFMIVVVATVLPFILMRYFTVHFSRRVDTLREAMHQVSNENYDVPSKLMGEDEISQAFADLQKMVAKIKEKDAKMYEARINAQKLLNAQQKIEMEVLASQINPHFLYNTLETIRMKAFTAGDRDVATAIKLLGKAMRYVLENTGTASTTLNNELDYIHTYLQIQQLRFGDRINFSFVIEEGLNTEEIDILPLLIQPIVENAIAHGLEEVEKGGHITIEVYTKMKDTLHIDISDNGCGISEEKLQALKNKIETPHLNPSRSIGIYNINQRIRLCYGQEYGIDIDTSIGKGTKFSLILPLKINRDEN